ncbi:hypothetical protein [Sphingobium aquiterrae]
MAFSKAFRARWAGLRAALKRGLSREADAILFNMASDDIGRVREERFGLR